MSESGSHEMAREQQQPVKSIKVNVIGKVKNGSDLIPKIICMNFIMVFKSVPIEKAGIDSHQR